MTCSRFGCDQGIDWLRLSSVPTRCSEPRVLVQISQSDVTPRRARTYPAAAKSGKVREAARGNRQLRGPASLAPKQAFEPAPRTGESGRAGVQLPALLVSGNGHPAQSVVESTRRTSRVAVLLVRLRADCDGGRMRSIKSALLMADAGWVWLVHSRLSRPSSGSSRRTGRTARCSPPKRSKSFGAPLVVWRHAGRVGDHKGEAMLLQIGRARRLPTSGGATWEWVGPSPPFVQFGAGRLGLLSRRIGRTARQPSGRS